MRGKAAFRQAAIIPTSDNPRKKGNGSCYFNSRPIFRTFRSLTLPKNNTGVARVETYGAALAITLKTDRSDLSKAFPAVAALLLLSVFSFGQTIDSLEIKLKTPGLSNETRAEILNNISRQLAFINPERALESANEALALSLPTGNKTIIANAYRNLSTVYNYYESYFLGMQYLMSALDLFKETGDSLGIGNCYVSLGHIYRTLDNNQEALYYHKKSFDLFSRLQVRDRIGTSAHNVGESLMRMGDLEKSRSYVALAIEVNSEVNNRAVLSAAYRLLGILDFRQARYQEAEENFNKVLAITQVLGVYSQKTATAESMYHLALIYKLREDYEAYVNILLEAAQFNKTNRLRSHLKQVYDELIIYFLQKGEPAKVERYMLEYRSLADSVAAKHLADQSLLAKTVVAVHDLEHEKRNLEKANESQKDAVKSRNIIILFTIVFSIILIVLLRRGQLSNRKLKSLNMLLNSNRVIIESQRQRLEDLNNTKNKFFSIVAHDLKSPLNSLSSFSSLLADHAETISKAEISMMSRELKKSVENTIKLADNLITWATVQMNEFETNLEEVSVLSVFGESLMIYREVAEAKSINVHYSSKGDLFVWADKNQLTFIIRNLVNNAIKFTRPGGTVDLFAEPWGNDQVRIQVKDTGIGMSDEMKARIISSNSKTSIQGTAGEKGTGLGLMLCYEFVKLNHASIELESKDGAGTTFTLLFPRKKGAIRKEKEQSLLINN